MLHNWHLMCIGFCEIIDGLGTIFSLGYCRPDFTFKMVHYLINKDLDKIQE